VGLVHDVASVFDVCLMCRERERERERERGEVGEREGERERQREREKRPGFNRYTVCVCL
jgi:hypothetical protein